MSIIAKSPIDKREYRYVTLDNKLDCLLVSDKDTEKSSACCDVMVGSMADPAHAQGLAHFLEHMLFLGTEKYPVENAYSSFLNSHGGYSNAYTAGENTVYYFDVQSDFLEEALDMFSSFFTCPLFTESATNREMNAVDSENTKNLQSDPWRKYQLFKSLARPDHPVNSFSTGNLETLSSVPASVGRNTRDVVIEFYNKYYSSNLMKVVVYGKEDLDTLQKWVTSKFSLIPNKNLTREVYPSDPFRQEQLKKHLEVVPIKDMKYLDIYFPIPSVEFKYMTKPVKYLSHLIGHESEGSILSVLKKKMWVNGLSCYNYKSLYDFAVFGVSVELTDEGIKHIDEITECTFAYIGMLKKNGPQEWVWNELKETTDMNFMFLNKTEPSDYSVKLANNMHVYAPEHTITGEYLLFECDLKSTYEYLDYLHPNNCITMVLHKGFSGTTTKKEKWYSTDYNIYDFAEDKTTQWKRSVLGESVWADQVFLPKKNPFIPTEFGLKHPESKQENFPTLVDKQAIEVGSNLTENGVPLSPGKQLQTWFSPDFTWQVPKVNVTLNLEAAYATISPLNVGLTEVLSNCVKEILNEYSYYADCAGLYYDVSISKGGLEFSFQGYNHKLPILVQKTMEELYNVGNKHTVSIELYNRIKEKVLRSYKNYLFWQPYYHCISNSVSCLEDPRWSHAEKYNALNQSTYDEFQSYVSIFLKNLKSNVLVHGNVTEEEGKNIARQIVDQLKFKALPLSQEAVRRTVSLVPGIEYVYRGHSQYNNPNEKNSAIENIYVVTETAGASSHCIVNKSNNNAANADDIFNNPIVAEAVLELLSHTISEPAFDQLRTKEQLGYIVFTGTKKVGYQMCLHIIVQSSHKDPEYLNYRVEEFLVTFRQELSDYDQDKFQTFVNAMIEKYLEKPKNIDQETTRYWEEIKNDTYLFTRRKELVTVYQNHSHITLTNVLRFYDKYFLKNESRVKFSSQFYGEGTVYKDYTIAENQSANVVLIEDSSVFKRSRPLLTVPKFA